MIKRRPQRIVYETGNNEPFSPNEVLKALQEKQIKAKLVNGNIHAWTTHKEFVKILNEVAGIDAPLIDLRKDK